MISVNDKKFLNKLKNCTVWPLEFQEQCLSIFFKFNFDSKTEKKNEKIDFTTHFPSSVYDHSCEREIV